MSDWLKRQSDEFVRSAENEQNKRALIASSDHWAKIRQQVVEDVQFLNTESAWKHLLKGTPVTVALDNVGEIRVEKQTLDAVYCVLRNHIELMQFEFRIAGFGLAEKRKWAENWDVDSDGTHVMLSRDHENLAIPERVSEHLLQPIIDVLKEA